MALCCKQHLDVLRRGVEDGRKVGGRHPEGLDLWRAQDMKGRQGIAVVVWCLGA